MVIRDTSAQDVDLGASGSRKRNRVRLIGASVVVVAVAVVGWAAVSDIGTAEQFVSRDRVRTAVVRRGDFVRDIAVQGRVVAAGHSFVLKPWATSADGQRAIRTGNSIVIDERGARRLGRLEMAFRVLD